MEATSNSIVFPMFTDTSTNQNPILSFTNNSLSLIKKQPFSLKLAGKPLRVVRAVKRESSGESDEDLPLNNGFGLVSEENVSQSDEDMLLNNGVCLVSEENVSQSDKDVPLNNGVGLVSEENVSQGNTNKNQSGEKDLADSSMIETPLILPHVNGVGSGTRAGLFRTPISGGVQSATSAHGLPPPELAVRNLMEQARFAHLCTVMSRMHHRREGYPFGSLVDFATDSMGHPIFLFSPLGIHTRNLLADPRCTLVVQTPGWSGLSNARVTIFGDIYPLPEDQQEWAHKKYIAKHHQGPSQQWGNFFYFRMQNISDIYFIGGFGTVAWVDVKEYESMKPDKVAVDGVEQNLKELNAIFSKPLRELLSSETEIDDAALLSIDSKGVNIRVREGAQFNVQRISFSEGRPVETLEEAKAALWNIIKKGQVYHIQR